MTDTPVPPLARLAPKHWVFVDWAVVALLAVLAVLGWRELAGMPGPRAVGVLIVAASVLPAGLRRAWPRTVLAVVAVAGAVATAFGSEPAPALAAAYVMYVVPLRYGRRDALRLLAGALAVTALGALVRFPPPRSVPAANPVPALVTSAACIGGAWALGYAVRHQRAYAAAEHRLREREAQEAVERRLVETQRAHSEERLQIARELHDVVAHAMSVIAVQAGIAGYVAAERPEEPVRALASIQETSRGALQEMRVLLGVLRDDTALHPAPGLANVGELVSRAADAGIRVEVTVTGERPALPAGMDLAAYRVAQEAVTNVVKHSGADSCRLGIDYQDSGLRLEIVDHGDGGPDIGTGAGAGSGVGVGVGVGTGHGLVGMRERVAMYGGQFSAGPVPGGGGFRVAAVFPLTSVPPLAPAEDQEPR